MDIIQLMHSFKFCPVCKSDLIPNPAYRKGVALYCPEHGDYFINRGKGGWLRSIILRPYADVRDSEVYQPARLTKNNRFIRCIQNNTTYSSIAAAARDLSLDSGNISRHLKNRQRFKRVGGYTFVEIKPREGTPNVSTSQS